MGKNNIDVRMTKDATTQQNVRHLISDEQAKKMKHAIGMIHGNRKPYKRAGFLYFRPYRNRYKSSGRNADMDDLVNKHLAERIDAENGEQLTEYRITKQGLMFLSWREGVYIYSETAETGLQAERDVLQILLDDAVYCGYGNWVPTSAREIEERARLPKAVVLEALHVLQEEGNVRKTYYGDIDDEGWPHCIHGWTLTKKWIDQNAERYRAAQLEEYRRIDEMCKVERIYKHDDEEDMEEAAEALKNGFILIRRQENESK